MSIIGYAVCATPKGIEIISNGIFKEYNIENRLYLDGTVAELSPGNQVMYLERFSSNQSDNFDSLLVSLYGFALPIENDRRGSFIGSAIAFSQYQVNTSKLKDGLFSLYNQIKKITDQNERIKYRSPSEWGIKLPDSNKDYGIQIKEKFVYKKIKQGNSTCVVQVSDFNSDIPVLLTHFILNNGLHHIQKLYITNDSNLTLNIEQRGVTKIDFNSFFNYDDYTQALKSRLEKILIEGRQKTIENEKLTNQKEILDKEINRLATNRKELEEKQKNLLNDLKSLEVRYNENKQKELIDLNRLTALDKKIKNAEAQDIDSIKEKYEKNLKKAVETIECYMPSGYSNVSLNTDSKIDEYYNFAQADIATTKIIRFLSNRIVIFVLGGLLLFNIVYFSYKLIEGNNSDKYSEQPMDNTQQEFYTSSPEVDGADLILNELKQFNNNSFKQDSLQQLNQCLKKAFEEIKRKNLLYNSSLTKYVLDRPWRFWELNVGNSDLTSNYVDLYNKVLKSEFQIGQFDFDYLYNEYNSIGNSVEKQRFIEKRLNNYYLIDINIHKLKYLSQRKTKKKTKNKSIDQIFQAYKKDMNDIYQFVPLDLIDSKVVNQHFLNVINSEIVNTGFDEDNIDSLYLPYLK